MKNITLSVDERVLRAVKKYAAEMECSVNALVREYLTGIANRESRAKKARARIVEMSAKTPARIGTRTWRRDDLHER